MLYYLAAMRTVVNFILLLACFQHSTATHRTLQDARNERSKLMNKYIKTLKKEEGAIKLVGGRHDYEGEYCIVCYMNHEEYLYMIT